MQLKAVAEVQSENLHRANKNNLQISKANIYFVFQSAFV
jgi:hypothetical protein